MLELKNEKIAIPVVLFSGLIWSFGPLVVRYMNEPQLVIWQYIFARGLTIATPYIAEITQEIIPKLFFLSMALVAVLASTRLKVK